MSKKNETVVTPKGTLKYPKLFTPDTKFKAEGEYSTKLVLSAEEAAPLKAKLKLANFPWANESDKDGNETGNIEFKTALKAHVKPKDKEGWDQRPQVLDAKRKPVAATTKVGSGTTAKLAVEVNPWYTDALGFGIQLRLRAVQIIDLVEFGNNDASSLFDEEEGFAAPGENITTDFDEHQTVDAEPEGEPEVSPAKKSPAKSADF